MKKTRQAFTLIEMILVLALIVLLAALTVPSLNDMYGEYKVMAAVDTVRAHWAEARSRAIDDGRPYRFAIVKNKGNFRVAPEGPEFWANSGKAADSDSDSGTLLVSEGALPNGIRFTSNESGVGQTSGNDTVLASDSISLDMWSGLVTFLPDGTATSTDGTDISEIRIIFESSSSRPVQLLLRTLTGTVTVRRLNNEEGRP